MNLQLVKKEHYFLKKKLVTHLCCWFLATFYFLSLDCLKLICPRMFLFPERQYRSAPLARVDISPRAREGPSLYTFLAGAKLLSGSNPFPENKLFLTAYIFTGIKRYLLFEEFPLETISTISNESQI